MLPEGTVRRFLLTVRVVLFIALIPSALHAATSLPRLIPKITATQGPEGDAGTQTLTLTYNVANPNHPDMTGDYQTVDGTATVADNDYLFAQGKWIIPSGQTASKDVATGAPISLVIVGDKRVEADETFSVVASNVQNVATPAPVVLTIQNDDVPVMTVSSPRVAEGSAGTVPMIFDVTLVPAAGIPVQATYQISGGTATAGQDFQPPTPTTLTFAPGETQKTVTVLVNGDTTFEPDETLILTVTPTVPPGGVAVTGTGTIVNDEVAQPHLTIVSGKGQQGILGQPLAQPLVVQVIDDAGAALPGLVVQWQVTSGSAALNPATSTTNAQGRASTTVTLNTRSVTIQASVAQLPAVTFSFASVTSFGDRAKGPVAVPIAKALDQVCAKQANDIVFADACLSLSKLTDAQLTPTLERVAPQPSGAQSKVASEVVSAVTSGIGARLAALRSGSERFSVQRLSFDSNGRSIPVGSLAQGLFAGALGGGAGDEEKDYNGWSAFLSGNIGSGERVNRLGQLGFDLKTRGAMFGMDRQVGDGVIGGSVNWMHLDSKLDDAAGSLNTTGYAVSVYGSRSGLFAGSAPPAAGTGTHYDGVHIDGSLTAGRNGYDAKHVVDIPGLSTGPATAKSRNNADVFALAAGTGLEAHRGKTDFDLSLASTWSRAKIDDLTESGSGPLILFVQGHEIESLVATAGFNVRSAWPVPFGTLLPSFRAEMIHEFKSGARLVTARFLHDVGETSFTIPIDSPDVNYGKLGAGLQADFPHGVSAFVEVTQDVLRSDLHFRTLQFNVRKAF